MDAQTLLAGGAASMIGIEAASAAASFVKRQFRQHSADAAGDTSDEDNDVDEFPYVIGDADGTLLCFNSAVLYVGNAELNVVTLQENVADAFLLTTHHGAMLTQARAMKNRSTRFQRQYCSWLLHMVLSDLNTLLRLRPYAAGAFKTLGAHFLPVISNMTRNGAVKAATPSFFDMFKLMRGDTGTSGFNEPRKTANDLVKLLDTNGGFEALSFFIRECDINPVKFFCIQSENASIIDNEAMSYALEHNEMDCRCQIVTTRSNTLKYVFTQALRQGCDGGMT
jgi:hypothetical protein